MNVLYAACALALLYHAPAMSQSSAAISHDQYAQSDVDAINRSIRDRNAAFKKELEQGSKSEASKPSSGKALSKVEQAESELAVIRKKLSRNYLDSSRLVLDSAVSKALTGSENLDNLKGEHRLIDEKYDLEMRRINLEKFITICKGKPYNTGCQ